MKLTDTLVRLVACALLLAPAAGAQEVLSSEGPVMARGEAQMTEAPEEILSIEGVEIIRDATELQDLVSPPPDRDIVDSVLVFTNDGSRAAHVGCTGYNGKGHVVGRIWLRVPVRGLRLALASDLSEGRDFIGSVRCWTSVPKVVGSAFLLKPLAVTDLPSQARFRRVLVEAETVEQLSNAGELSPQPVTIDPATGLPKPIPLRMRLLHFPVVATY